MGRRCDLEVCKVSGGGGGLFHWRIAPPAPPPRKHPTRGFKGRPNDILNKVTRVNFHLLNEDDCHAYTMISHTLTGVVRIFQQGGPKQGSEATEQGEVPPPTVGRFLKIRVSKWHFLHIK